MEWMVLLKDIGVVVGVPILRNVVGWAQRSFADGKVDRYEWVKLGETVFRVGAVAACGYWGLSA